MSAVVERKIEVLKILRTIEKYPATSAFKHEMMTYAYILVCASIEFMIENIVREWLNKSIKHHDNSSAYRGKKYVEYYLTTNSIGLLSGIDKFSSTKLENIRWLIGNIAGDASKTKFNILFNQANQSLILQPDLNARLDRIRGIRHALAHGSKLPNDIQPNMSELKEDFLFVYKHIIQNVSNCLPRV